MSELAQLEGTRVARRAPGAEVHRSARVEFVFVGHPPSCLPPPVLLLDGGRFVACVARRSPQRSESSFRWRSRPVCLELFARSDGARGPVPFFPREQRVNPVGLGRFGFPSVCALERRPREGRKKKQKEANADRRWNSRRWNGD